MSLAQNCKEIELRVQLRQSASRASQGAIKPVSQMHLDFPGGCTRN